jgi:DNA-binding protein H-NS
MLTRATVEQNIAKNTGSSDPWQDLATHMGITRELVELKHKKKVDKQAKSIAELEARLAQTNAEIQQFKELLSKEKAHNVELVNKISEMETGVHSITTNDKNLDAASALETR